MECSGNSRQLEWLECGVGEGEKVETGNCSPGPAPGQIYTLSKQVRVYLETVECNWGSKIRFAWKKDSGGHMECFWQA